MTYSLLIHRAMDFAARAHATQSRKQSATPFIGHVAMVGCLLERAGMDETVVAAGLLHDVIEDTEHDFATLEREFGREVAELVDAVTEPDKSVPWQVRKNGYIRKLRTAPDGALAIAAADKTHNIHSMILHGEAGGDIWGISKGNEEQQLWYFRTVREIFSDRFGADAPGRSLARLRADFEEALRLLEGRF